MKIILSIFFSDDILHFQISKKVWDFYLEYFHDIELIYVTHSEKHRYGEVFYKENILIIGVGDRFLIPNESGLSKTGVFHPNQHARWIFLQNKLYQFLLQYEEQEFYLYQSTITNIINLKTLNYLVSILPKNKCYAGYPGPVTWQGLGGSLRFISGANQIFSRDVLELMVNRYNAKDSMCYVPNDVWQAYTLRDIPRFVLPRFDIEQPRNTNNKISGIYEMIHSQLNMGHFHFRVKTSIGNDISTQRENIDPWIMLKIIEAIIDYDFNKTHIDNMLVNLHLSLYEENNGYLKPFTTNEPIWKEDLNFFHNDTEYLNSRS